MQFTVIYMFYPAFGREFGLGCSVGYGLEIIFVYGELRVPCFGYLVGVPWDGLLLARLFKDN